MAELPAFNFKPFGPNNSVNRSKWPNYCISKLFIATTGKETSIVSDCRI